MLGSTLLSAATALFFLPAVFSAPVAPATSVSVSDVSTTISTTKGAAFQQVTTVLEEKKSQLDAVYDNLLNVDASEVDLTFVKGLFVHVNGILSDTQDGVQTAWANAEDSVAVDVSVSSLVVAVAGVVTTVLQIVGHVLMVVQGIEAEVIPLVATVLALVISLLGVVASLVGTLVPQILILVGGVLVKVEGLVPIILEIVACNVGGILSLVAYLGLQAVVPV